MIATRFNYPASREERPFAFLWISVGGTFPCRANAKNEEAEEAEEKAV
jgi:hypothetical protein